MAGMNEGQASTTNSYKTSWSMMSYLARFNYNYKSKYYATPHSVPMALLNLVKEPLRLFPFWFFGLEFYGRRVYETVEKGT